MNEFLVERLAASRHREYLAGAAARRLARRTPAPGAARGRLLARVTEILARLRRPPVRRPRPACDGACCTG